MWGRLQALQAAEGRPTPTPPAVGRHSLPASERALRCALCLCQTPCSAAADARRCECTCRRRLAMGLALPLPRAALLFHLAHAGALLLRILAAVQAYSVSSSIGICTRGYTGSTAPQAAATKGSSTHRYGCAKSRSTSSLDMVAVRHECGIAVHGSFEQCSSDSTPSDALQVVCEYKSQLFKHIWSVDQAAADNAGRRRRDSQRPLCANGCSAGKAGRARCPSLFIDAVV